MSEYIKVAVDAMGGDYAPQEPVKGVVEALQEKPELYVYLVGQEDVLKKELDKYTYPKERLEVVHASEIIETGEPPVHAIQKKKDSSLVKALRMVRSKEASAFVSCGSTGAVLVGGQVLVGKSKGVVRAPLAPLIPTATGVSLLIDCGANVDARSSHLVQFARMGSIYMEYVMGVKNPKVGLVNIGAYEGVGATLISKVKAGMMSTLRSKIGALLVKPALKETLKSFDASEYGGAPLLGLKGLVVKAHGSSKANEIKNSLIQCITFSKEDICGKIQENMKQDN